MSNVLKSVAQLADMFANIFNMSVLQTNVLKCFKTPTIVTVPKTTAIKSLSDFCPVTLTPIVIKFFETLVQSYIKYTMPVILKPHQYA